MSFRRKILLAALLLFLIFLGLLIPFVETTVERVTKQKLMTRAVHRASTLKGVTTLEDAINLLNQPAYFFESKAIFDPQGNILWASHPDFTRLTPTETQLVLKYKINYSENYAVYYHQIFANVDQVIIINGETYILRNGFPLRDIQNLTVSFEVGFLVFGTFILLLYTLIIWLIISRITRPVQQIIDIILPYQEGRVEVLPRIHLGSPPSNEFTKLANTLNSLSERTQKQIEYLKQQRKETEGILESLGEGVIALTPLGKISFANEVACNIISTRHEDLIGRSLDEVSSQYPDLLFRCTELVLQVLQTSEPIVQTWSLGRGSHLYLHLVAAPLADQNGAILVLQDKTSDYKVLEMGKDFIANASHELRTPITVIRGFAETLHDLPKISQAMMQEISAKILRTTIRLEKLVRSLLTLSDIENLSKENFQPVDLIPIIEQCKSLQLAVNPDALITVECDQSKAIVQVDPDIFEMAIMNLLDNGIKYSTPPAQITIRIKTRPRFILEVEDKGIGIPEADLPHIFDRFYTVDKARSRQKGGAGLGLSIVRTIVEKHGGQVAVFSQEGKGTHFRITLPNA